MHSLNFLVVELKTARTKLLDVFEEANGTTKWTWRPERFALKLKGRQVERTNNVENRSTCEQNTGWKPAFRTVERSPRATSGAIAVHLE